ncbi:hypothetical protein [Oryza sativa Japonica Group]|uniref:Uncharacterized protein n=1 Tax=Oryza sativa subsp. japonica TaxID=39947 RepID=Q5QN10_ORYSJ|nr:hypothetical protein [Oryza sativa Japonica Group]
MGSGGGEWSQATVREGADVAGKPPYFASDVGDWGGRERGDSKMNPASMRACTRAEEVEEVGGDVGRRGVGWRKRASWGGAKWARRLPA